MAWHAQGANSTLDVGHRVDSATSIPGAAPIASHCVHQLCFSRSQPHCIPQSHCFYTHPEMTTVPREKLEVFFCSML